MRIHTKIVLDIETGQVVEDQWYEYRGPLALCDRSMQRAAKQGIQNSNEAAGTFGSNAATAFGTAMPMLKEQAYHPTGMSTADLGAMESGALGTAAGTAGAANERARLAAQRSGNAAATGALGVANTEAAARGAGSNLSKIIGQNAALKAQQQQHALSELGSLYGMGERGQIGALGVVPEDIKAGAAAGQTGWLQNTLGVIDALGGAASGAGSAMSGLAKLRGGRG